MAHNVCCDSHHIYKVTYLLQYCTYIGVKYVTCAISWDRCSLIGLLVMSVVVVLVLLLFSFPVDWGGVCPLVLCILLLHSVSDRLRLV